jgi:hypothetical protein
MWSAGNVSADCIVALICTSLPSRVLSIMMTAEGGKELDCVGPGHENLAEVADEPTVEREAAVRILGAQARHDAEETSNRCSYVAHRCHRVSAQSSDWTY